MQRMSSLNRELRWHLWDPHVHGNSQLGTVFSWGLSLKVPAFMRVNIKYHMRVNKISLKWVIFPPSPLLLVYETHNPCGMVGIINNIAATFLIE